MPGLEVLLGDAALRYARRRRLAHGKTNALSGVRPSPPAWATRKLR